MVPGREVALEHLPRRPEHPAGDAQPVGSAHAAQDRDLGVVADLDPQLSVLDRWSGPAERLGLLVVLGERSEHLVLGHAKEKQLVEAARWMDQAFALVDPLVPVAEGRSSKPTVAILMDQDSQRSEAWAGLLDELGRQQLLIPEAVAQLAAGVQGVTLRQTPLFVQPTFDVAGNAAAGDDEFRLGN